MTTGQKERKEENKEEDARDPLKTREKEIMGEFDRLVDPQPTQRRGGRHVGFGLKGAGAHVKEDRTAASIRGNPQGRMKLLGLLASLLWETSALESHAAAQRAHILRNCVFFLFLVIEKEAWHRAMQGGSAY